MEIKSILIFALIGAVCMYIVTGGALSMVGEENPSTSQLASGAVAGAGIGSAISYFLSPNMLSLPTLPSMIGGGGPDMKVGLPAF
jgi:hypothetical protein